MPEPLEREEVASHTDPSVSKQYDAETPKEQQIRDFFDMIDGKKIGILNTHRRGIGAVGRSMAIGQRSGPDILFLANAHSRKFSDLSHSTDVQITFQDSKTQDWISITGTASTFTASDPRVKQIWSAGAKAWFGDLGDGTHDGSADDPRMALIEVKARYASYYLTKVGLLGFVKEVGTAAVTGKVADTGVLRELSEEDLEMARRMK